MVNISKIKKINEILNSIVCFEESIQNEVDLDQYVLIKDLIWTKDFPTTAGNKNFKDYLPPENADVVNLLLNAGFKILGKSNAPDLGYDIQTFNDLFGTTNNPWDINKTVGGSSGGNAAAIASGQSNLAIGTDLAGSLRIPSSFCGIYSLRPTERRISNHGQIITPKSAPIPTSELVIGPMSNSLDGIDMLMSIICRESDNHEYPFDDYIPQESKKIDSIAVTYKIDDYPIDDRIVEIMKSFISMLNNTGLSCNEINFDFDLNKIRTAHTILSRQIQQSLELEFPFNKIENDNSPSSNQILNSLAVRNDLRNYINNVLGENDIWIFPVTGTIPFDHNYDHKPIQINGTSVNYWKATISYCVPFSLSGHPVLTLPIGTVDDLPVGIQVVGNRWEDDKLVAYGKSLVKLIKFDKRPNVHIDNI